MMVKTLTDLLEAGETLMHPIYGILNQGNMQYYGYFGFTEKYLLIALLSGKQVTYTTRIPLDIKSVSIKKTLIFRQYVIDISFNEGTPCRITASPKVLTIAAQKENLPKFLEFLSERACGKSTPALHNIAGEKIRWQYFNTFIYIMLSFLPMPFIMIAIMALKDNTFALSEWIEAIPSGLLIFAVFLAPFIFLSLLNRFFFGKIVGVANKEGLYLENDFIPWKEIEKITYTPDVFSKHKAHYSRATVVVKQWKKDIFALEILHFPLYGLRIAKKYNPQIKMELGKNSMITIGLIALSPTIIAIILPLIL